MPGARSGRLVLVIVAKAITRVSSGASGILVGLYLANLANHGSSVNAALVGTLGAVSFGAELLGALPMGVASDAVAPRALMTGGTLLGAFANAPPKTRCRLCLLRTDEKHLPELSKSHRCASHFARQQSLHAQAMPGLRTLRGACVCRFGSLCIVWKI